MNIHFGKSPFFTPVTELLRELSLLNFFSHGLLIGSRPMIVHAEQFSLPNALMTNDIDFAVSVAMKIPELPRETSPKLMATKSVASVR